MKLTIIHQTLFHIAACLHRLQEERLRMIDLPHDHLLHRHKEFLILTGGSRTLAGYPVKDLAVALRKKLLSTNDQHLLALHSHGEHIGFLEATWQVCGN